MPTAKKPQPKKTASAGTTADKEHLTFYLPKDLARQLRTRAVVEGKRYSALLEEFVIEGLARRG